MATIVEMINPLTGLPEQVDKLDHTAQEIDDAVDLAPQLSNPNLLDNWYFPSPVNQRGQTSYTGEGYTIDRWETTGTVVINNGYITASGNFIQKLPNGSALFGRTITASIFKNDTLITGTVTLSDNYSEWEATSIFDGCVIQYRADNVFAIIFSGGNLKAVKLELGGQQTLAHQDANGNWVLNEIPDYGEQLRRCQRYDYIIGRADDAAPVGLGTAYSETSVIAVVELPETMRANPAVSITGLVNLRFSESKNISVSSVSNYGFSGDKAQLYFSGLSGLTQGQSCDIYVQQGSKIEFNANL